jgi:hypothetical protein
MTMSGQELRSAEVAKARNEDEWRREFERVTKDTLARAAAMRPQGTAQEASLGAEELAQEALGRDVDVILARLEAGISKEREAMDDLIERLRQRIAA